MRYLMLGVLSGLLLWPSSAAAHQPQLIYTQSSTRQHPIQILQPQISQAFYGVFKGAPEYLQFKLENGQEIYISALLPVAPNAAADLRLDIRGPQPKNTHKIVLDGTHYQWKKFWEKFAGDFYLQGPEETVYLPAGTYEIEVLSRQLRGKYVVALGTKESFSLRSLPTLGKTLLTLKTEYFGKTPWHVLCGRLGQIALGAPLLLILISGGIIFLFRRRHHR